MSHLAAARNGALTVTSATGPSKHCCTALVITAQGCAGVARAHGCAKRLRSPSCFVVHNHQGE